VVSGFFPRATFIWISESEVTDVAQDAPSFIRFRVLAGHDTFPAAARCAVHEMSPSCGPPACSIVLHFRSPSISPALPRRIWGKSISVMDDAGAAVSRASALPRAALADVARSRNYHPLSAGVMTARRALIRRR